MEFNYKWQPGLKLWNRDLVTDGEPLVTIVTPYYNGAEYVEQTFNCVINQTFPWFEWIIVNDGSTRQEDVDFVENLAKKDPRVRVVHKENGGISTARNFGMRQAKTKYVMSLDCDDLIEPTYLEYCWWMMEKNPEAAWAYTDSVGFQNQEYMWKHAFNPELLKTENHLTEVAFIRKKCYDEIGGYAEVAKHYNEDWYFYLRLVAAGHYPVQSKNDFLSWYRRRDDGVLSIVHEKSKDDDYNTRLIESVANQIIDPHEALIFPITKSDYDKPRMTNWNKSIYKKHDKIHVTILTSWLELGGADKFNLDLIAGLNKDKFEVSILTTVPSEEQPWQQRFRRYTPDVFNMPNFMKPKDYAEFLSYFLVSRETDILMVTNSYHGYYMIPWIRSNFPKLAIVDYVHMEEWYWRKGGYARTSAAVKNITEKTYVCNSGTEYVLSEKFDRDPSTVETVHIGVDEKFFNKNSIREGILYNRLEIEKDRPVVLFICRLHAQKRPLMMVEIAKRVKLEVPEVAFVVVGNGGMEDEVKERVKSSDLSDTVYFAGAQTDVRPYYRDAKLTLICSIKEGLALTTYESCSMGVPVISANVGGQCDLIGDDVGALIECRQKEAAQFNAKSFPLDEVNEYVEKIVYYLKNDEAWEKASKACVEKVHHYFTIEKMISKFESEFERIVNDKEGAKKRLELSQSMKVIENVFADYLTIEMKEQSIEDGSDITSTTYVKQEKNYPLLDYDLEKRLNSIEKSLANHEEVVCRHEEEVNKHNDKIDYNWNETNALAIRIQELENAVFSNSHKFRLGHKKGKVK